MWHLEHLSWSGGQSLVLSGSIAYFYHDHLSSLPLNARCSSREVHYEGFILVSAEDLQRFEENNKGCLVSRCAFQS